MLKDIHITQNFCPSLDREKPPKGKTRSAERVLFVKVEITAYE